MIDLAPTAIAPAGDESLAQRMQETCHVSPLRRHATALGLRDGWDLLALAVQRGCRHCAGVGPQRAGTDPGESVLANEELVVLLLAGENRFEPFLIRAAAELLRAVPVNVVRLVWLARRERVGRVLAHIARAGVAHDPQADFFWAALVSGLGPVASVPPGVLPHWSRFVALRGVGRGGRPLGKQWLGAAG